MLRRYQLNWTRAVGAAHSSFRQALVPALNRLGINPVGVFNVIIGPDTPSIYVLLPCASLDALVNVEALLGRDQEYLKAGEPFINAPDKQPAYSRMQSWLMLALEGRPKLAVPPATAKHEPRLFELRIYEAPTDQDHKRKIEMINAGYYDVFQKAGFWQVFYADMLVGTGMPNLAYMLSFADLTDRTAKWKAFYALPEWKSLAGNPRYTFEDIVSRITNIILSPADYSQI
jgi:hypothetical protein